MKPIRTFAAAAILAALTACASHSAAMPPDNPIPDKVQP